MDRLKTLLPSPPCVSHHSTFVPNLLTTKATFLAHLRATLFVPSLDSTPGQGQAFLQPLPTTPTPSLPAHERNEEPPFSLRRTQGRDDVVAVAVAAAVATAALIELFLLVLGGVVPHSLVGQGMPSLVLPLFLGDAGRRTDRRPFGRL